MPVNLLPKHLELLLQGKPVGKIETTRMADSWHFGTFEPERDFAEFATLFGEWSLLLHADEKSPELSKAASEELSKIEAQIDSLRAELLLPDSGERLPVDQINIDGDMVEWKLAEQPGA